jgi:CMP-N,N'-diacetyllegionaminic acid synthase
MYGDSSLLAVIPARGGSKGLPGKNILDCAGRPLIEWTIATAKAVRLLDDVLVTTDSPEIAEVSRNAGASVPFLRPDELATDDASLLKVVQHAWEQHRTREGVRFDYVVVLQPTSPLRTAAHIEDAVAYYFKNRKGETDTLASVYDVGAKYGWLMQNSDAGDYIRFCMDVQTQNPQRQKLKRYFMPNGAIFIVQGAALAAGFYTPHTLSYVMSAADSIDVDSIDDLAAARQILASR